MGLKEDLDILINLPKTPQASSAGAGSTVKLSLVDCVKQLRLYGESCRALRNEERAIGFLNSAEFIENYCEDLKR